MSIFHFLKLRPSSKNAAAVAKERLQIVVSHKSKQKDPEFLQKLHTELVAVISKYVQIDADQIRVQLGESGDCSVLELNVTLPPNASERIIMPEIIA